METQFTAHNELEKQLIAVQKGQLDSSVFMNDLITAQVFMPVQDESNEIQGFQKSSKANPLTLDTEDGQSVLILFTSPERAKPFLVDYPDYQVGLLSEFSWILDRIGSGIAISLNPGMEVGIDFDTDMVEHMIHASKATSQDVSAS